ARADGRLREGTSVRATPSARRLRTTASSRDLAVTASVSTITALLAFAGVHKFGTVGVLLPVAVVLACILLLRPLLAVPLAVTLAVICEGPQFGILTFTSHLYTTVYGDISILDVLVAGALVAVGLDVLRDRRPLYVPRPLILPLAILAIAMV